MADEITEELETWVDPKSKVEYKVPKGVAASLGGVIAHERTKFKEEYESKLTELSKGSQNAEELKSTLEKKIQELEFEKLPAAEREKAKLKKDYEDALKLIEKKDGESTKNFERFKNHKQAVDIQNALSGYKLTNAKNTLKLIMMDGLPEFIEDGQGEYLTKLKFKNEQGEVEILTPDEYVKKYLALPENFSQLESSIRPGSGSPDTKMGLNRNGTYEFKRSEYKSDSAEGKKVRKAYFDAQKAGHKVSLVD